MSAIAGPISPGAWVKSLALHGAIVAVLVLVAYSSRLTEDQPRIIELVAGPGDDMTAREAPALGTETAVKLALPQAVPAPAPAAPPPVVLPEPAPVRPVQEATPILPAPPVKKEAPKTTPKKETKEPDPAKNIAKDLKSQVSRAKQKAQREADKARKEEAKRIAKADFDAKQKAAKTAGPTNAPKTVPGKFTPVDVKGIKDGVTGGSSNSKVGAGGKELTRAEGTLLELYYSKLLQEVRRAYEEDRPPGLSDTLKVTIELRSNPDGSFSNIRVEVPSGMPDFDRAVVAAFRRVKMPPRPDKKSESMRFEFQMREN